MPDGNYVETFLQGLLLRSPVSRSTVHALVEHQENVEGPLPSGVSWLPTDSCWMYWEELYALGELGVEGTLDAGVSCFDPWQAPGNSPKHASHQKSISAISQLR